jgi:hypothetical protein
VESNHQNRLRWVVPVTATLAASFVLMVLGRAVDFWLLSDQSQLIWEDWYLVADAETARTIILSLLEVLAGVFAITITVVAIIVQLSATRYTSRVVDLFLEDPFNRGVLFAYVVPLVYGFWLANSITEQSYSRLSMTIFIVISTLSITLVIPYFNFVFRFLKPDNIINKIETASARSISRAITHPKQIETCRNEVTHSIQQLSDILQASLAQSDIALALHCLSSLHSVSVFYLPQKEQMNSDWFQIPKGQIIGLSDEVREEVIDHRIWVEMQIFKRYEIAFTSSLRKVRDINSSVAMNLRDTGDLAIQEEDGPSLEFVIKGFNTLIMYALSERDIRSTVHVFHQYRLLTESLLDQPEIAERIAAHFKYYGQNSQRRGIHFIMDAVAYDLRTLIMRCIDEYPETLERLLAVFLELDQTARNEAEKSMLKGVRKSQAILGSFFIRHDRQDLAARVLSDMALESPKFMQSVKRELFAIKTREFWEIEDRGVSFYYVAPENRPHMEQFFAQISAAQGWQEE